LRAFTNWAPQRNPTIPTVVVMEVAESPLVLNEEAQRPVTHALIDVGQRQHDVPHLTQLLARTHWNTEASSTRIRQPRA